MPRRFKGETIELLDLPPVAERCPHFSKCTFCSPHAFILLHGPLRGCSMIAAVVDAWSVNLGDVEEILHDLRVLEGLILDLR